MSMLGARDTARKGEVCKGKESTNKRQRRWKDSFLDILKNHPSRPASSVGTSLNRKRSGAKEGKE